MGSREIIDEINDDLSTEILCDEPPYRTLSISASSTTACCQHSHRLFEDGEDVTYTFTFRIFSALNANAVIKVIFPPEFNSLGVNPSAHAISGIVSSTSASGLLEGEIHENTILISDFHAINAETLITIEIRHVQNPPFRSFPSDSQITYVENGICLSDDIIKIGKYDTEEACKDSCYNNIECTYYAFCAAVDAVQVGYENTGNCKTRTIQSNGVEIESMQLSGVIGIQYAKADLTVGDRYCIDAVAMNAENMDAYLWVEGDTAANRIFSDSESIRQ